jgi:hypothetical protein
VQADHPEALAFQQVHDRAQQAVVAERAGPQAAQETRRRQVRPDLPERRTADRASHHKVLATGRPQRFQRGAGGAQTGPQMRHIALNGRGIRLALKGDDENLPALAPALLDDLARQRAAASEDAQFTRHSPPAAGRATGWNRPG